MGNTRRPAIVRVGALFLLAACTGCPTSTTHDSPKEWSAEERQAVGLAADFLAKNKTDWGRPEAATRQPGGPSDGLGDQEKTFMVTYRTPPEEEKVGGPRAVFVNIGTGKAMFVPRD